MEQSFRYTKELQLQSIKMSLEKTGNETVKTVKICLKICVKISLKIRVREPEWGKLEHTSPREIFESIITHHGSKHLLKNVESVHL